MKNVSRREFIIRHTITGLGVALTPTVLTQATPAPSPTGAFSHSISEPLALLGGKPIRAKDWPTWPIWKPETDEKQLLEVIRSGIWSRASVVTEFEKQWASTIGAKRCLSVVNGTNALIAALRQFDIQGGDEVLVPAYTFIGTVAPVLATGAMPIFVDIDPETFQIDPTKIEAKITPRTRAIIPVHILGLPVNMKQVLAIAKKHKLVVIEDACQAHMAEISHQKVGTFGDAGCFSFQNSKNLAIGEGGAIVSNNDAFMDRCFSYHNYGNPYGTVSGVIGIGTLMQGTKLRLTEYQAAIGLALLKRLDAETTTRNENAAYLKAKISKIPGIVPYKLYDDVTRAAFHLFPFRFIQQEFKGLSRELFVKALKAEGIPCSTGYAPLNKMPYLDDTFKSKNYQKMYPKDMLDFKKYLEQNACPQNDRICNEEAIWLTQNMLLGSRQDMDDIASAIEKIYGQVDKLMAKK